MWDVANTGRVCAGTGFKLFLGAVVGYYPLCETRLYGNGIFIFPVARERDFGVRAGRVCADTGFHIYHEILGLSRILL